VGNRAAESTGEGEAGVEVDAGQLSGIFRLSYLLQCIKLRAARRHWGWFRRCTHFVGIL